MPSSNLNPASWLIPTLEDKDLNLELSYYRYISFLEQNFNTFITFCICVVLSRHMSIYVSLSPFNTLILQQTPTRYTRSGPYRCSHGHTRVL